MNMKLKVLMLVISIMMALCCFGCSGNNQTEDEMTIENFNKLAKIDGYDDYTTYTDQLIECGYDIYTMTLPEQFEVIVTEQFFMKPYDSEKMTLSQYQKSAVVKAERISDALDNVHIKQILDATAIGYGEKYNDMILFFGDDSTVIIFYSVPKDVYKEFITTSDPYNYFSDNILDNYASETLYE